MSAEIADRAERRGRRHPRSRTGVATAGVMASVLAASAQGSAAPIRKRGVGGDAKRQRVARDQAFDRARPTAARAARGAVDDGVVGGSRGCASRSRPGRRRSAAAPATVPAAAWPPVPSARTLTRPSSGERRACRAPVSRACRAGRGNRRGFLREGSRHRRCASARPTTLPLSFLRSLEDRDAAGTCHPCPHRLPDCHSTSHPPRARLCVAPIFNTVRNPHEPKRACAPIAPIARRPPTSMRGRAGRPSGLETKSPTALFHTVRTNVRAGGCLSTSTARSPSAAAGLHRFGHAPKTGVKSLFNGSCLDYVAWPGTRPASAFPAPLCAAR